MAVSGRRRRFGPLVGKLVKFLAGGVLVVLATASVAAAQPPVDESAVVRVLTSVLTPEGRQFGGGSGFFVNDIHIVTNEHVVTKGGEAAAEDAELLIVMAGEDSLRPARLVWSRADLDLAVIEAEDALVHGVLPLAAADLARGEDVFAVGYPGSARTRSTGLAAYSTLTEGILSRTPFQARWGPGGAAVARALQHTAAINPGSSGGPLMDRCGSVVGVNTARGMGAVRDADGNVIGSTSAQGIFFALATSELAAALDAAGVRFSAAGPCDADEPPVTPSPTAPPVTPSPTPAPAPPTATPAALEQADGGGGGSLLLLLLLALVIGAILYAAVRSRRMALLPVGPSHPTGSAGPSPQPGPAGPRPPAGPAGASPPAGPAGPRPPAAPGPVASPLSPFRFTGQAGAPNLPLDAGSLRDARLGISIGRNSQLVDHALNDPALSRRHFRVSAHEGRVHVADLRSTHGTFVNGKRLTPYHARRLEPGDTIRAGATTWRFTAAQ